MNTLKEKIKYYREKRNISKSELARNIGVSPSYITMLENGEKTNPSLEIKMKIAKALKTSISELIGLNDALDQFDEHANLIAENEVKNTKKYKKLYEKITTLLEDQDYTVPEYELQPEDFEALNVTISDSENEKITTIAQSNYIEMGKKMLDDIEMYKEMRIMYFLKELKENE